MSTYITVEEYTQIAGKSADSATEINIRKASGQIDTLTFNRIISAGFENLTELQQNIIRTVCAMQADFLTEYGGFLESPLSSYGIGNVSMSWDNSRTVQLSGVTMPSELYSKLLQTGLCSRVLR